MDQPTGLTAIVASHHRHILVDYPEALECKGYKVKTVDNIEIFLEDLKANKYSIYLMDLNLGKPGSDDISPSISAYGLVREDVEQGRARFIGFSNSPRALEAAAKSGIPARESSGMVEMILYKL